MQSFSNKYFILGQKRIRCMCTVLVADLEGAPPKILINYGLCFPPPPFCIRMLKNKAQIARESIETPDNFQGPFKSEPCMDPGRKRLWASRSWCPPLSLKSIESILSVCLSVWLLGITEAFYSHPGASCVGIALNQLRKVSRLGDKQCIQFGGQMASVHRSIHAVEGFRVPTRTETPARRPLCELHEPHGHNA